MKEKLTFRGPIKPENLGFGCQVLWCLLRTQDLASIFQFGLKDPPLLEQAMYRILEGNVLIDVHKNSTKNKVSNNHIESDSEALYRSKESKTAVKSPKTSELLSMSTMSMHAVWYILVIKTCLPCAWSLSGHKDRNSY